MPLKTVEDVDVVVSPIEWGRLFNGGIKREQLRHALEGVLCMGLSRDVVHVYFKPKMPKEAKDGT